MKEEFMIKEVNEYHYFVEAKDGLIKNIYLQFYDIDQLPQKGDYICLSEKYFDRRWEGWSGGHFSFGGLNGGYGRDMSNVNLDESEEIIIIKQKNNKVYLKRFYG